VSRRSGPPLGPEAAHDSAMPTLRDRERIRQSIDRSLARGAASGTVLRVDAAMAERALGGAAQVASFFGSKLALLKVLIPALLIGSGVGAIWARSLFDARSNQPQLDRSLPVDVEDLDGPDLPGDHYVPAAPTPRVADLASVAAAGNPAPQPSAARPGNLSSRTSRATRRPAADVHSSDPSRPAPSPPPPAAPSPQPTAANEPATSPQPQAIAPHLSEELRLMRAASTALSRNDMPRTLNVLSEHATRFPEGALREERRALRVISLCKQGRSHFALVERDEFLSSSPRSPLTARVREACEASP
jgi:hypothetical protein